MRDVITERRAEDAAGATPPVRRLETVVPRVSAPILNGAPPAAEAAPPDVTDVAQDAFPTPPLRPAHLEVAGLMVAALAVGLIDVRLGLLFGAVVCAGAGMRAIDPHIAFSFGDGFVGYRPDPAWPHGVQEDDDVHWNWTPGRSGRQTDRL